MIRVFNGGILWVLLIYNVEIDGFRLFLCYKFEVLGFLEECKLFLKVGMLIDLEFRSLNVYCCY